MKTQDEKQAGGLLVSISQVKPHMLFMNLSAGGGSSATALPHSRCQFSKSPPTAHLQDPVGPTASLLEMHEVRGLSAPSIVPLVTTHLAAPHDSGL